MEQNRVVEEGPDPSDWVEKLDSNQIWIKVFSYLTNSSDLTSVYFTCEIFRKHVEQKRKLLLMPRVFDVLRDKGYLKYDYATKVAKRDVLNLRLVSKAFKDAVEKRFLEFEFDNQDWYMNYAWYPIRIDFSKYRAEKSEKAISVFLPQTCKASSFRSVSVFLCNSTNTGSNQDQEIGDVAGRASRFLNEYGNRLWIFDYTTDKKFFHGSNFQNFIDMLSPLSNLRSLSISIVLSWWFGSDDTIPLSKTVQFPFPNIPSLRRLDFSGYSENLEHLIADILDKNPGIKSLSLSRCTVLTDRICQTLSALQLEDFQLAFRKRYLGFKQELAKLLQFDWPLKKLYLKNEGIEDFGGSYKASECNLVIGHFRDTLEDIYVELEVFHDRDNQGLRLPNLKILKGPGCSNLRIRSDAQGFVVRDGWY